MEGSLYRLLRKKFNILNMQHIASQWGLQLIFRMHNSDPTPQGVEHTNMLLSFKCILTTWPPHSILVFDWLISKKSSPLKPLSQMN
jgi:hypothetical protein